LNIAAAGRRLGGVKRHTTGELIVVALLRRAGLAQIRFHDLRHSFASLLIAQGEHPKYISEQLGHASVQITLDRYGHLMPQSYGHAGDRLEAALFGASLPALASTGLSDGAAGFRSEDEPAETIPLVAAVSRQETALAVPS
jgi:hypothetical protein